MNRAIKDAPVNRLAPAGEAAGEAADRAAVEALAPTLDRAVIRQHGLFLPRAVVLDVDGLNGQAWRGWLGV